MAQKKQIPFRHEELDRISSSKRASLDVLSEQVKQFNEQEKIFHRLKTEIWSGEVHPELWNLWSMTKHHSNTSNFGAVEAYIKAMKMTSFEGLTFNEIGDIFNFIETLSLEKANQASFTQDQFLDILDFTYHESAVNIWNKQVDAWKEEIAHEKQGLVDQANMIVTDLNRLNDQVQKAMKAGMSTQARTEAIDKILQKELSAKTEMTVHKSTE